MDLKILYRKCYLILLLLIIITGCADDMLDPVDTIEILSVTPDSGIAEGDLVNFTVEVFYNLAAKPNGILLVGFSTDKPNAMSLDLNTMVKVSDSRGFHRFDFGRTVETQGTEPFSIFAILAEHPYTNETFRPFSIDKYTIVTGD